MPKQDQSYSREFIVTGSVAARDSLYRAGQAMVILVFLYSCKS